MQTNEIASEKPGSKKIHIFAVEEMIADSETHVSDGGFGYTTPPRYKTVYVWSRKDDAGTSCVGSANDLKELGDRLATNVKNKYGNGPYSFHFGVAKLSQPLPENVKRMLPGKQNYQVRQLEATEIESFADWYREALEKVEDTQQNTRSLVDKNLHKPS